MDHEKEAAVLRIGELSRRVGVSEHLLRAWETRYGLLRPQRSAGGYRLYSEGDQSRVLRMQAHLAGGLAAAQAAQAAIAEEAPATTPPGIVGTVTGRVFQGVDGVRSLDRANPASRADLASAAGALRQSLEDMDEPTAQALLDRLLTEFTVEKVLRDVVLPYLRELGERWESGAVSVAQEHFASYVVRGRLTGLARGWGNGRGPRALLACPPGERHDLALLVFGIVLNRGGWRVDYLGANTPTRDVIELAGQTRPSLVVLAASTPERFAAVLPDLSELASLSPLVLAGAGATRDCADTVGALLLMGDPVTAAERLAGL